MSTFIPGKLNTNNWLFLIKTPFFIKLTPFKQVDHSVEFKNKFSNDYSSYVYAGRPKPTDNMN